jgi:DNA-binding NarL/FixJ family response regulator
MINIVVIDGKEKCRTSIKELLSTEKDFEVLGVGKDGYDALRLAETLKPAIIMLDINLPFIDGVKATSILKNRFPEISIIILTSVDDDEQVLSTICNGASGYILKCLDMEKLADMIRVIYNGGSFMTPQIATKVFRMFSKLAKDRYNPQNHHPVQKKSPSLPSKISKIELQIIIFIGQGLSNREIAEKIQLREGTIRNYITSILQKIALRDRTQIAIYALQQGLVPKDAPHMIRTTCRSPNH